MLKRRFATLAFSISLSAGAVCSDIETLHTINFDNHSVNSPEVGFYSFQDFNALNSSDTGLDLESQPRYLQISTEPDFDYLKEQTYTILGLSVVTVGLMTLLPESITKWDDDDRSISNLGQKWVDNVKEGPVWDRDEHFLNYIMHPYFGGVYYTAARHAGYDEFDSFLYSAFLSTFFWEYGVEAFAEVPSWQDLFITPFFGAVVGELMFEAEQDIVAGGGEVWGSESMGNVTLFFLNPVGHIHGWVTDAWGGSASLSYSSQPWFGNQDAAQFALDAGASYDQVFYGVELEISF
ncbi:ubiquitin--protein ligase [Vibrio ponticus]|uniref:Ubiquitin--protein ligase n=1 Tax=Vibrio ponticus TaxID=265668 RepID=A0ABX3FJZ6_9VIBR|nr:ubiquitin--protein ligase [Vibrio ponticus]